MIARSGSLAFAALVALVAAIPLVAAPAPARAQPAADERARAAAHFKQGQAFFQNGDFDRAIAEYQAAYELSKEPLLIFNIALCHDRSKRPEPALAAFRRYLELSPEGDVADEAREDVARLAPIVDKLKADREAQRAAEDARRREREQREVRERPRPPASRVPLYVMGAGAAVAAAGGVFHVMAWQTRKQLEAEPDPDSYFSDRDTFKQRRVLAIGGYAVGAAAILTGLILKVTVFRQPAVELSASPAPGGAVVTLGWAR